MRKLFTTLKSVVAVAIVASMTLASSCSYDDTAIKNRVDKVEKDLAALTERVTALENQLKSDVAALTELINNKAVVTNLTTDANGVTTVELSNGKSFKVYPECTVEDTDTNTYIGVKADEDGVLYFALFDNGVYKEWLTIEGEKVPVYDGKCECTPVTDTNDDTYVAPYLNEEDGEYYYAVLDRKADNKFVDWYLVNGEKVAVYDGNDQCECEPVELKFQVNMESGMLEFSVDGGLTWNPTGLSAADAGQQIIAGVTDNGNNTVTFTLAGNSSFTVIKAALIEFDATRGSLYVLPGETKEVNFTINTAVADVNVMNQPLGWSAEVVLAPADEEGDDEVDPGMGIFAAGGTELVLKITGPAQEFVDAGFAAKEGDIVVHFNGNNGTCQVGKIAVNLAELTLAVDAEGNVHIENSITNVDTDEMGEDLVTFAPIQIGVMTKACYDEYLAGTLDILAAYYDGYISYTTGGFNNVVDRVQYQEGTCEKEVYDITVEDVSRMFYPNYEFVPGGEYVIFLYTEEEIDMDYYEAYPVLDSAIMAYYKSVIIEVSVVDGSISWNDATLNLSLAGYTNYLVGWIATSDVEEYIEWGYCTDLNSYLDIYLKSQYGGGGINTNAGVILAEGMPLNTEIKLSEMAEYSLTAWAPSVESNTTYYLFVYPFNMESEMDLYTLSPSHEDAFLFGTFTTAGLVEGNFDTGVTYEVNTMDANTINVHAKFNEDVVLCYWHFFEAPVMDPSERALETMQLCQNPEKFEWSDYCEAYTSNPVYPIYLGIVAVNANGEYVYVEKAFEPEPLPEGVINSFEYLGRYKDLDDDPSTSGGGYIYLVKCADGNEYKIEVYYDYCNEDGTIKEGTYDYCWNAFDSMYSSWAGFCIESSEYYHGSRLIVEADKITLEIANVAAYVYTDNGTVEPEPQPLTAVSAVAGQHEFNGNVYSGEILVTFTMSDNSTRGIAFKTGDNNYITPGTWQGNAWDQPNYITYIYKDGDNETLSSYTTLEVSYANDVYTIAPFETFSYVTYEMEQFPGYTGTIEGLDAPAVEEPGDNTGGEVEDGVIYVNTFVETGKANSYCDYFHFKDETGDNQVKLVVGNEAYGFLENGWPKAYDYSSSNWRSSVQSTWEGLFSFINQSLIVNGTTYANSDVSDASASVDADGNITINFTVGGTAYVFKHNKQ
ncbi:MAG: hypothetical protein IKJ38_06690 [Alistipes sp.]|nr:hypothetical protein [Alistipes sp.]